MFIWTLVAVGWTLQVTVEVPGKSSGDNLPPKCFGEELAKEELISVETSSESPFQLDISGPDSNTVIFSERERKEIRTAFTATESGAYWMCVYNRNSKEMTVRLNIKVGPDAKDYSQIAKKEHLEPAEIALRKVEETLRNYHRNVLFMRQREDRMRQTNDSTAFRIIGFCLFSVLLMILLGGWQMYYFKQFFKSKKII